MKKILFLLKVNNKKNLSKAKKKLKEYIQNHYHSSSGKVSNNSVKVSNGKVSNNKRIL